MELISNIILQAANTAVDSLSNNTSATKHEGINLLNLLMRGGWIMLPILLLLFGALYIFVERLIVINRSAHVDTGFMNQIQTLVQAGNIDAARTLAQTKNTPVGRMLDKGLRKIGKPIEDIEKALESAGKLEVYRLEKNLPILGNIAGIAPMFGFIGTIAGVIVIFHEIELANNIDIGIVAGGLYQKMITSAAGLAVGIIAKIAYHYLVLKIDREIYKIESTAIQFIDLLQEPTL